MSMWICQDRNCLCETSCGPLTLPTHFMSLTLIPKQRCTGGARGNSHGPEGHGVKNFCEKKKKNSVHVELLNKYIKPHKSSIIYLQN